MGSFFGSNSSLEISLPLDVFPLIARHSDVDSMKQIRLTCSSINELVTPLFASLAFRCIHHSMQSHSLERMKHICTTTWTAKHVREIHLRAEIGHGPETEALRAILGSPKLAKPTCDALQLALQGLQYAQNHQVRIIVSKRNYTCARLRPRILQRCVLDAIYESGYPLEELHLLLGLYYHEIWDWKLAPQGLPLHLGRTLKRLVLDCQSSVGLRGPSGEEVVFEDTALARILGHASYLEHLKVIGESSTFMGVLQNSGNELFRHLQKVHLRSLDFPLKDLGYHSDIELVKSGLSLQLSQYNAIAFAETEYPTLPRITLTRTSHSRTIFLQNPTSDPHNSLETVAKTLHAKIAITHQWNWDQGTFAELESDATDTAEPILKSWPEYRDRFLEMQNFFVGVEQIRRLTLSQSLDIRKEFWKLNVELMKVCRKLGTQREMM